VSAAGALVDPKCNGSAKTIAGVNPRVLPVGIFISVLILRSPRAPSKGAKSTLSMAIGAEPIEASRIAAEHSLFVGAGEILSRKQLVDFMAAFLGVKNFMGKIAAKYKRFASGLLNCKAQAVVVDIEADVDFPLAHLPAQIIARLLPRFRPADDLIVEIHLQMTGMIGTVEAVEKERHPGRAAFEKGDADARKFFEDTMGLQSGCLNGDAERVSQCVNRVIGAETVHAEMVQGTDMHR
jgi:hypothetical protein